MGKVISIEPTPNPHAKKFMLDSPVCTGSARSFEKINDGIVDPLAHALFEIDHITSIFYVQEFVTVSKAPDVSWDALEQQIISTIEANLDAVIGSREKEPEHANASTTASNPLLEKINAVLDEKVRPALAGDGGGLNVLGLDGLTLKIHYQGACGSCPSATTGTMMAIENVLKKDVDERIQVTLA
jgi:Fe-S cluster biogenesis protein NfuA